MNPTNAVKIIEQALNAATVKGVYTLTDTNQILLALNVIHGLVPKEEPVLDVVTE
jgi:ferric-dicitrate binding protein FerR (iron transport regulator)